MNENKNHPLSSEDIDQPLIVVSTRNWLALFAIALLAILSTLWLILGSIPEVVHGQAFYWQKDQEKVIYGALPVDKGQKVGENFPVLMHLSAGEQIQGKVTKNFMVPMNLEELEKNIPYPPLASFLIGKNQNVLLIEVKSLQETSVPLPSGIIGEISIQIKTLRPIQYVIPSWGVKD